MDNIEIDWTVLDIDYILCTEEVFSIDQQEMELP